MSRPDPRRRPTKAERKEQARLERERIRREMAVRSRNRRIGLVLVMLAVAGAAGAAIVAAAGAPELPTPRALLDRAAAAAQEAGCADIRTVGPYGGVADPQAPDYQDQLHIGAGSAIVVPPALGTYPSVPPTSGPHNPVPLSAGVYTEPPAVDRLIHSLEHGAAVIWYDPEAPAAMIEGIADFYGQADPVGQDRVIVAPYDYPDEGAAGILPPDTQMVLVAWHRLQTCAGPNLAAAFGFTSQYSFPTFGGRDYQGEAPQPGASM
jgi:hypothetical protein